MKLRQDISFTRRGRGQTAIGALIFDKMISGRQIVFRETNKPINYSINIEHSDDHKRIRLEDSRSELHKRMKSILSDSYAFIK